MITTLFTVRYTTQRKHSLRLRSHVNPGPTPYHHNPSPAWCHAILHFTQTAVTPSGTRSVP